VIKTLLETLIVIPSLILICEWTVPNALALSPWVSHVNKLKTTWWNVSQIRHLHHTIGLVKLNSFSTVAINRLIILS
jgi:hypothetical protein